jgi:hypothetical protein
MTGWNGHAIRLPGGPWAPARAPARPTCGLHESSWYCQTTLGEDPIYRRLIRICSAAWPSRQPAAPALLAEPARPATPDEGYQTSRNFHQLVQQSHLRGVLSSRRRQLQQLLSSQFRAHLSRRCAVQASIYIYTVNWGLVTGLFASAAHAGRRILHRTTTSVVQIPFDPQADVSDRSGSRRVV